MNTALQNRLSDLSPAQLKELMKKMGKEKKEMPVMPRNQAQLYPVTSAQKRMWFLAKLDPDSYLYTNPIGIRVKARQAIDIDLFVKGFETVVQRHEIMRTSFISNDGQVFQKVNEHVPFEIEKIDLSGLTVDACEEKIYEILEKDGQTAINIETFPLFRFRQLTLNPNEFVFIYTSHHIISDAWSSSFIFRSMQEIFEQALKGIAVPASKLKYQFIDYVNWEQNWLGSDDYKAAMSKWRQMLPEAPEPLRLPLDFKRPAVINYQGALHKGKLSKDFVDALRVFSKNEGVTLFHTLLSCFNIVLQQYSGSEEIVVGIPMSNRKLKEFQETIGMFLNTLPHRTVIDNAMPFREYLHQVKQISQDMMAHQDVPFDKITEALNPQRDMGVSPIFQVLFVFQNIPAMYEWDNLAVAPVKADYSVSKYDLNLWLEEVADELVLSMTCQTSLFRKEMMPQFLEYFENVLKNVIANPEKRVGDVFTANETALPEACFAPGKFENYIAAFEDQARLSPEKMAVSFNQERYTYAQLNAAANRLANYLLKKHGQQKIIGLAIGRSPQLLVVLLAIHKTGAAYLPIDINLPQERLDYIIENSGIKTVVTDKETAHAFSDSQTEALLLEDSIAASANENPENPNVNISPDALAYIMYTSGSTGQPKGVCIGHAQLLNYSEAILERMRLPADACFASISAFTTDLGNTQIFPALIHGGCIAIVPDDCLMDPAKFSAYVAENGIDCLKIVPSYLRSLLADAQGNGILPQKLLILGGEPVPASLIMQIRAIRPDLRIINHYGPTETTIGILTHEIEVVAENDIIPLGKPLANNIAFIADEQGRRVPKGIPGEIVICGNNVGLGYLNNEALSEQQFTILSNSSQLRVYKTGDIGRVDYDGNIQFLGRADKQVKVRGFRIETDEIEKALLKNTSIIQAVVLARNEQMLTAYIVNKGEINLSAVKKDLKAHLPAYMIPDEIVMVSQIPRHGNGKINTKALENHKIETSLADEDIDLQPRDETELQVKQVWEEVLKQPVKGIHSDFFDSGGNSLMAIEIIAKLNSRFKTDLNIGVLFECNTVQLLASKIRNGAYAAPASPLVLLRKGTVEQYLFLVHPAGGDVLRYYELTRHIDPAYHIYGLQAKNTDNDANSIREVAAVYLNAVSDRIIDGKFAFGGWSMGALIAYEMAQIHKIKSGERSPVIILDQKGPSAAAAASISTLDKLAVFGEKINHLSGRETKLTRDNLDRLDERERSALFLSEFKAGNLVPEDLKNEEFHGFLDVMLHHNAITMQYKPEKYDGPVLLIKAQESVTFGDAPGITDDYGWMHYVPETLTVKEVPGNHITLIIKPNVENVGNQINLYLNQN